MKLIIVKDYEEMSTEAANVVVSLLEEKPSAALGLTTGRTPMGLYRQLVDKYNSGLIHFKDARIFSLEEYLGVGPYDQCSLYAWLKRELISPCKVPDNQVFRLDSEGPEPQLSCMKFDEMIVQSGGLDLVVEGIGPNAHIGFNEPGSPMHSPTRIVSLNEVTLDYNEGYWNSKVPQYGLTVGMSIILSAKKVLLMASGLNKAEMLAKALNGPVTSDIPASYLQLIPQLTVIADSDAASILVGTEVKSG